MSTATRERKSPKGEVTDTELLVEDKFTKLWSDKSKTPAKVAIGVGESAEYGAQKVSVTVTLNCDQNERTIDKAGELAFYKAVELLRDGWSELQKEQG